MTSSLYRSLPTGEITAAVPVPKTSSSLPSFWAWMSSSTEIFRSSVGRPQSRQSWSTEFRVIPGRMDPLSMGVTTLPSILKKMFMAPTSSMYFRSTPSSHRTWE